MQDAAVELHRAFRNDLAGKPAQPKLRGLNRSRG